jgi:hypothetical protein
MSTSPAPKGDHRPRNQGVGRPTALPAGRKLIVFMILICHCFTRHCFLSLLVLLCELARAQGATHVLNKPSALVRTRKCLDRAGGAQGRSNELVVPLDWSGWEIASAGHAVQRGARVRIGQARNCKGYIGRRGST